MPIPLRDATRALEGLAPLALAESWDNVGLLLPGRAPDAAVSRVALAIDLTEEVAEEIVSTGAELVLAYHPPIFEGLKRFSWDRPKDRVLLRLLAAGVAVWSPHTALDSAEDGLNDWLAEGLGEGSRRPIEPPPPGFDAERNGVGRVVELAVPIALDALVARVKAHLGLEHVRVASSPAHARGALVRTVALCAGAGGSVLAKVQHADVLWTGEMRHHDVLARTASGASAILCDHTNTERAYLPTFARRVAERLGVHTHVCTADREPLVVV
jgi:dinuclear metal center YbgI/SA1388 family protein